MSVLALPSVNEACLYLKNNGFQRSLKKLIRGYIVGRQEWYLTLEDVTRYLNVTPKPAGFTFSWPRLDDVPRMHTFTERIPETTLRTWCGPEHFFLVAEQDGVPVSYRCLATLVHPGVVGFIELHPHQLFMVDEFTTPSYRRRGITRQMAIAMAPRLVERGYREVLGIHRTDNQDTIAAVRAKRIPTTGTITRRRRLWRVSFEWEPCGSVREMAMPSQVIPYLGESTTTRPSS
jgi:GNAT superfamily N-acetyltransferase